MPAARPPSSRPKLIVRGRLRVTLRCTAGGISSRTSSVTLKQFRRIATRYDKTDQSFSAMIYLAASFMALK